MDEISVRLGMGRPSEQGWAQIVLRYRDRASRRKRAWPEIGPPHDSFLKASALLACEGLLPKGGQTVGAILSNTSWLATIVGTVLCMGLGFFWYNPKFPTGKAWAEGAGVSLEPPDEFPALAMGLNTLGLFLAAIFVGAMPVGVSILAILAYGVLNTSGGLFAGKSVTVGLVHIGYWLVGMVLILIANAIF